jgi:hypothetical protein
MKIRTGFVSNSSSSSFVACLPDNFDINTINFEEWAQRASEYHSHKTFTTEDIKKMTEDCILYNGCCEEDTFFHIAPDMFKDYIICQVDVSSDSGSFAFLNTKEKQKLREILK